MKRLIVENRARGPNGSAAVMFLVLGVLLLVVGVVLVFFGVYALLIVSGFVLAFGAIGYVRASKRANHALAIFDSGLASSAKVVASRPGGRMHGDDREVILDLEVLGAGGAYRASTREFVHVSQMSSQIGRALAVLAHPEDLQNIIIDPEIPSHMRESMNRMKR